MRMGVYEVRDEFKIDNVKSIHLIYDDQAYKTFIEVKLNDDSVRRFSFNGLPTVKLKVECGNRICCLGVAEFPKEFTAGLVESVKIKDGEIIIRVKGRLTHWF